MSDVRRRAYLLVLICMGLFAHSVGGYVPFFLFAFTLTIYLGAAAWALMGAQGIVLTDEMGLDNRVMVGQDCPLSFTIKNASMVSWPWLTAVVETASGVETSQAQSHYGVVGPRERKRLQVHARFVRRGRYDRMWVRLTLRDLLGLFDQEWIVERHIDLTVLPRILPIEGADMNGTGYAMGLAERALLFAEDVAEPVGLRPYVHGDSIRRVHWRTTAKTGELMVKTYAHQSRAQVYLYLDCCAGRQAGTGDASTFERGVVVAASLAHHLLSRRVATGLVAAGAPAAFYPARDHRAQELMLLDALAVVQPVQTDGTLEQAEAELHGAPAGSVLVLISTMTSERLQELVLRLRARQRKVAVVQIALDSAPAPAEPAVGRSAGMAYWTTLAAGDDLSRVIGEVSYALLG